MQGVTRFSNITTNIFGNLETLAVLSIF